MSKKKAKAPPPDTTITLTLPGQGGIVRTGTILIKRGELAQIRQFQYCNQADIAEAIAAATASLIAVEAAPPPKITTRPEDEYKPDLEAKRQLLVVGATVRTGDAAETGEIVELHEDQFLVDVGKPIRGCYPITSLTLLPKVSETGPDPLTIKGQVKPESKKERLPTDVTPTGEAQLTLF